MYSRETYCAAIQARQGSLAPWEEGHPATIRVQLTCAIGSENLERLIRGGREQSG